MVSADHIAPIVSEWLARCPGQPLVLRADPVAGTVEARIGLGSDRSLSGAAAARGLGVSFNTFKRADFYGLRRDAGGRFSRLVVERLRDNRAA